MFNSIFAKVKKLNSNDEIITQRRFPRRERDACVCIINKMPYPVQNWSLGGVLLQANPRFFDLNQKLNITLKYRLPKGIMSIDHSATVIRKTRTNVALKFSPLEGLVKNQFEKLIKEYAKG